MAARTKDGVEVQRLQLDACVDLAKRVGIPLVATNNVHYLDRRDSGCYRAMIANQAAVAQMTHTCFMISPYESYVAVAEKLNRLTPGDHAKKSALFNSGAEAVENAVKIARLHTKRQAVVVFEHAYHGRTNLTMAMTGKNMPYKQSFGPFASEIYRVPLSYPFHDGNRSGADVAADSISKIEKEIGADNVAAIIIEPIAGEGGFIVPADGFLPALSQWTKDNGALFIADEIQTGFARTGQWFAVDHEGVVPDIVTTATLSMEPVVKGAWLKPGAHLDLVGAYTPKMRESDDEAVRRARIYVDTRAGALKEGGDIVQPLANRIIAEEGVIADLFELARGKVAAVIDGLLKADKPLIVMP